MSPSARCSEDVDLVGLILEAVGQIPRGRVATFGDIARALGDVRAARAVGAQLASKRDAAAPSHRVVLSDGRVGGSARGPDGPIEYQLLLQDEGVNVEDGVVTDLDALRFSDFHIPPILSRLQREQEAMRSEVIESDDFVTSRYVSGLDVSYHADEGCVALVRMDVETLEVVEERVAFGKVRFPYVPGYLGYRELPLARLVVAPRDDSVLLVDGQGVLHPRGFGIACQIGICLDVPTIGAAKSLLLGQLGTGDERADVLIDGKVRGRRVRPKGRKGIFVSVGHRVSLETACAICERMMLKGVPEPLRLAHVLATRERMRMEMGG